MKQDKNEPGRHWGPFSGRQLTTIIVAISAVVVMVPTAALAASGAFTSTTSTPAVTGTNSGTVASATGIYGKATATGSGVARFGVIGSAAGTGGIGVRGNGTAYGVFSNGPLGVAGGKPLVCTGCVGTSDLEASAKKIQPLAPGESQTGSFFANDVYPPTATNKYIETNIPFVRPVPGNLTMQSLLVGAAKTAQCPAVGSAAPGYVCLYGVYEGDVDPGGEAFLKIGSMNYGLAPYWVGKGGGWAQEGGTYTVTAPT